MIRDSRSELKWMMMMNKLRLVLQDLGTTETSLLLRCLKPVLKQTATTHHNPECIIDVYSLCSRISIPQNSPQEMSRGFRMKDVLRYQKLMCIRCP